MKMEWLIIQVPRPLKAKLAGFRGQGYTGYGYIRTLLDQELNHAPSGQKGR